MKSRRALLATAVLLSAAAVLQAEKFSPVKAGGELVLFDAASHDLAAVRNYTARWIQGSDLTPVMKPVTRGGEKFAELSYSGKSGSALSTFWYENVPAPDTGMRYDGLRFTMDYDKNDYAKVSVQAKFTDNTAVTAVLTLEQGCRDYVVRSGFRRAKTPPDWRLLSYTWLSASADGKGNPLRFRLKRIVMCQVPNTRPVRRLELGKVRKVHEILPLRGELRIDGNLDDPAWRDCRRLASLHQYRGRELPAADSPFQVWVAYDDDRVCISTQSEFPTPPVAKETRRDGSAYGDEAQEFFFSGPNDNDQKVQFVFNAKGVIFDCAREHDLAAAEIRTKIDRSIKHDKAWRYERGLWTTEIAFPLAELQVDLSKQRHMGFQIAQSYIERKEKKLRTMVWSETRKFPSVPDFGVLVFNRHPFGPGTVEVSGIQRLDNADGTADFRFDCSFKGFAAGSYQTEWTLVPGHANTGKATLNLSAEQETKHVITVAAAESRTGLYTLTLTVLNTRGDARVCAVNFKNDTDEPDLFGQRLFGPRLKHVRWRDGEFAARAHSRLFLDPGASPRTRKTASIFAEKYYAYTGVRLETLRLGGELPPAGVVLRVSQSASYDGKPAKPRKHGYCLSVGKDRVLITGFDEPGLYYGLVTFYQLMRNSMRIRAPMPVPCVDVYDWPDLPFRMVSAQGTGAFRNQTPRDNYGIEYMMEWTDRFVAGHKANVLFWDLSSRVRYKRRPEFNGSERIYSLEDLKRFGQFCRDRFVEVCPAWQIGGHANWWLLGYHPELREKGYRNQADVTHPEHNKIVMDCMLDVIEALDCKYVSPKGDEWWGPRQAGETPDARLSGKTRAEAFLDFHVQLNEWLKRRNITMLLYHDMLTPYHNGKKFDVYKIADRFPKDVIINYWGGRDVEKGLRFFDQRGFPVWIQSTGERIWLGEKEKRIVKGYGKILYSLGNDKTGGLLDEYSHFNNLYAAWDLLDYAWNLFNYRKPGPGRAVTIKNISAVRPNPHAGEKITPLDIGSSLTQSFNALVREAKPKEYGNVATAVAVPAGTREIGFVPTRLEPDQKGNCAVVRKGGREVTIPVNAAYSSLIFLHTAFINNPKDKRAAPGMGRYWIYGWPCGDYFVHYEDGETRRLPVRLSMNIRRFDTSSNNRATNENRYVLALKDANQENVHLFQWEWANPRPGKKIARLVMKHDNELDVSLILLAVSGRSVWSPDG